ncbi:MAG: GMP synthase, partial [Saprospiraceae bacterium]|nr:GMP synthase [Saprospiraceae bacterium]
MVRAAVLDMYDGGPGQGIRAIREILEKYSGVIEYEWFDVRDKAEVPDMSFDLYIGTGGPGSPFDLNAPWDKELFDLVDSILEHNKKASKKKYLFLICHSFQMVCIHLKIGEVSERKSRSFGTFPCHLSRDGRQDPIMGKLGDPFYVADFRNWQVVKPNEEVLENMGAKILALEKIRPHVDLERAIMAVRFSDEVFGTQFHPEADPHGLMEHFQQPEKKKHVLTTYGEEKFQTMIRDLAHPLKIQHTHDVIIPGFINSALENLISEAKP